MITRYILPNWTAPIIVQLTMGIAVNITATTGLSSLFETFDNRLQGRCFIVRLERLLFEADKPIANTDIELCSKFYRSLYLSSDYRS